MFVCFFVVVLVLLAAVVNVVLVVVVVIVVAVIPLLRAVTTYVVDWSSEVILFLSGCLSLFDTVLAGHILSVTLKCI